MKKEEQIKNSNDQIIDKGNLDAVEKFFTSDYVAHAEDKDYKGHDFVKRFAKQIRSSIPDISVLDVKFLVDSGNSIAWQRTLTGTHKADMMGIPASNKKIVWNEMVVSRFEGHKITEEWVVSELAGQLLSKQPKLKN